MTQFVNVNVDITAGFTLDLGQQRYILSTINPIDHVYFVFFPSDSH